MSPRKSKDRGEFSFEKAMTRLEEIVTVLESGKSSLEQSLLLFEEGVGLVRGCRDYLGNSRARVEALLGEDSSGCPVIEPFEEDVEDEE